MIGEIREQKDIKETEIAIFFSSISNFVDALGVVNFKISFSLFWISLIKYLFFFYLQVR